MCCPEFWLEPDSLRLRSTVLATIATTVLCEADLAGPPSRSHHPEARLLGRQHAEPLHRSIGDPEFCRYRSPGSFPPLSVTLSGLRLHGFS